MNIYVAHSTSFDFKSELYQPLKNSTLANRHNFVFPHENSLELFDSKSFLENKCDLMIAEVSYPSTGVGIELGWANAFGVKVLAIHKKGMIPSSSVKAVTRKLIEYSSANDLVTKLTDTISEFEINNSTLRV